MSPDEVTWKALQRIIAAQRERYGNHAPLRIPTEAEQDAAIAGVVE